MKWYDDADHLGYDWDGKKILKPDKGDLLDNFLKRMEDPDFWRTIKDHQTGQDVVLSEADIELITRIQKQRVPDAQFDEYAVSRFNLSINCIIKITPSPIGYITLTYKDLKIFLFHQCNFDSLAMGGLVHIRSYENASQKISRT